MNLLKKYFPIYFSMGLFYGFALSLIGIFKVYFGHETKTFGEMAIFSIQLFFPIGFILSLIYFYFKEIYAPKKKIAVLQKKQFDKFYQEGFILKDSQLEGRYKGYQCTIFWVEESPVHYNYSALILKMDCDLKNIDITEFQSRTKDKYLILKNNSFIKIHEFLFFCPSQKQIISSLNGIVDVLSENKIKPLK